MGHGVPPTPSSSSARGRCRAARLDPLVRDEVPHLLVRDHGHEVVVGPFVAPGRTACLRCVDCHLGELDPRRGLAVEQAATQQPLVAPPVDATLRAVALSLAVRDLVTFVEGDQPATWSATITVGRPLDLAPDTLAAARGLRLRLGRAGDRRVGTGWSPPLGVELALHRAQVLTRAGVAVACGGGRSRRRWSR